MTRLTVPVRDVTARLRRISCGGDLFAVVTLDFEPGDGCDNAVSEENLPADCVVPLFDGVRAGLDGVAARVVVRDARHHPDARPAQSFKVAGYLAARDALARAGLRPSGGEPAGNPVRTSSVRASARERGQTGEQ
ncbi:hypothetical protein ACWF94_02800 [Streptomyces sp. NPDC055078]